MPQNETNELTADVTTAQPAPETATTIAEPEIANDPFAQRWYRLVSATNWEKGKIILEWRQSLIDSGADAGDYSDEAWSRSVGGVTSPHVGRLRRVYERFGDVHSSYPGLFWSHFLAAIDWDDAEMWLEGASQSGWTVALMRRMRWEATGAAEADRPEASDIVSAEVDEDVVEPAQGGERNRRFDEDGRVESAPVAEGPDFGDDSPPFEAAADGISAQPTTDSVPSQPFAGLPELPDDLGEALEMFKLAILRHKAAGYRDVSRETVLRALAGLKELAEQPA